MRLLKLDKELCRATFEKFVQLGYPLHNEAWEHLGVGLYQNIKTGPFSVFAIATIASCEALPTRVSGARGVCAIFARVSLLLEFRHGRYAVTKFVDVYSHRTQDERYRGTYLATTQLLRSDSTSYDSCPFATAWS